LKNHNLKIFPRIFWTNQKNFQIITFDITM
jgi:hypothetical protein